MSTKLWRENTCSSVRDHQRKNNLAVDSLLLTGRWK